MRVIAQLSGPGVQHSQRSELAAEILRVASKFLQGGSGRAQEQAIDYFLMRKGHCP